MIAVTQHDHYYTGKNEEELSAMATRDHVHEGLLEVGYMVPKQQIVVVSGEALLLAVHTYNYNTSTRLLKFSIWRLPATSTRVRGRRWQRPLQSATYRPHCSPTLYKQCNDLAVPIFYLFLAR